MSFIPTRLSCGRSFCFGFPLDYLGYLGKVLQALTVCGVPTQMVLKCTEAERNFCSRYSHPKYSVALIEGYLEAGLLSEHNRLSMHKRVLFTKHLLLWPYTSRQSSVCAPSVDV